MEWDPLPEPILPTGAGLYLPGHDRLLCNHALIDFSRADETELLPPAGERSQAFTLWFRSFDFGQDVRRACRWIVQLLKETPFTTLQVVLEPAGNPQSINEEVLSELWGACQSRPSYLDRYYALQPGRPIGAKRIVVLLPDWPEGHDTEWQQTIEEQATVVFGCSEPLASSATPG
jgi:hypothetical protein